MASSPAKVEAKPPMALDLPPDPYEIGVRPILGLVTYQTLKANYDYHVTIGEQEPYAPESLLLQWNALGVSAIKLPGEMPAGYVGVAAAPAAGAPGMPGRAGGGGQPPRYPVTTGSRFIPPVDYVSPAYQKLLLFKGNSPDGGFPAHPGGGGGGGDGASPGAVVGSEDLF